MLNFVGSPYNNNFLSFMPNTEDQLRENEIQKLIHGAFINEENIDNAFEIAKKIDQVLSQHIMLSSVCKAYLELKTIAGCKKAFQVALFKQSKNDDIFRLLEAIIKVCSELNTNESKNLTKVIYQANSRCLAHSSYKNQA